MNNNPNNVITFIFPLVTLIFDFFNKRQASFGNENDP